MQQSEHENRMCLIVANFLLLVRIEFEEIMNYNAHEGLFYKELLNCLLFCSTKRTRRLNKILYCHKLTHVHLVIVRHSLCTLFYMFFPTSI